MARTKSVKDIVTQRNRIQQELLNTNQMGGGRYRKVHEIADRYIGNIENQIGNTLDEKGKHNYKALQKMPQSVYMGTQQSSAAKTAAMGNNVP